MGDRFPRRPELGGAMVEQCFENVRSKKKKKERKKMSGVKFKKTVVLFCFFSC